jgi:hypothetical protein
MILRKLNEIQENTDDSMKLVRQFKIWMRNLAKRYHKKEWVKLGKGP